MQEFNEKDWNLFKSKISEWQEAYIDRLNQEYIALLSAEGLASEKFWALEKKIRADKRSVGVVIEMRRSLMEQNILSLLCEKVITIEDLSEFSDELQAKMRFVLQNRI